MRSAAFIESPENYCFQGQDPDEDILLVLRAHIITNLSWIIPSIFIALLPIIVPTLVALFNLQVPVIPSSIIGVVLVINYLLVLIIVFEGFLFWYFNVHILTTQRIIDVQFQSLLFKNIDIASLKEVQEANSSMGGILRSIFNYGDVIVETAAIKIQINFKSVPKPDQVADMIMNQVEKIQKG